MSVSAPPEGFYPAARYFPDGMRQSIMNAPSMADLDGDGRLDLVLRSKYASTPIPGGLAAYRNTGTGFEAFATNPLQLDDGSGNLSPLMPQGAVAFGDIDNDGNLDVVVARVTDGSTDVVTFETYEQIGDAWHALTGASNPLDGISIEVGDSPYSPLASTQIALADYDGDGRLDLVMGSPLVSAGLWALRNTGSGFVQDTTTFADVTVSGGRVTPAFTHLDGDGHLDLVLTSQGGASPKYGRGDATAWHYDAGTNKFTAAPTDPFASLELSRFPASAFTDLDGDGDEDMVTGDKYGRLSAFEKTPDGSFAALDSPGSLAGIFGKPSFVDLDGDGDLDVVPTIASAVIGTGVPGFTPLENTGTGFRPFTVSPFIDTPSGLGRAVSIDFDNDGDQDLLFTGSTFGYSSPQVAEAFERTASGFVRMAADPFAGIDGNHRWTDVVVADLNADGRDDLVVLEDTTFKVLLGTASGFVEDTANPLNGFTDGALSGTARFARVDFDRDGDIDIVTSEASGKLEFFTNLGDHYAVLSGNPISGSTVLGALPLGSGPVFVDVDGDGDLDFVGSSAPISSTKYGDPTALVARQAPDLWLNTETGWERAVDNPYATIGIYNMALPIMTFADLDGDGHVEAMSSEKYGATRIEGVVGLRLALGTPSAEALNGTPDNDILRAFGGNDTINGLDGDDVLSGGAGADSLNGGAGNDTADYNDSAAAVNINLANGRIRGGDAEGDRYTSIESLGGTALNDTLTGSAGNNRLDGRGGGDSLSGGDGNDTLDGGTGQDTLVGGGGIDSLSGGDGDDLSLGGTGADAIGGGAGNDTLYGDDGNDSLVGGDGNDRLRGRRDDDSLEGGDGADALTGDEGNDTLTGGLGNDTLNGSDGNDVMRGGVGADTIGGGAGSDVYVYGGADEGGDLNWSYHRLDDAVQVSAAGFGGGLVEGDVAPFVSNKTGLATSASGTGQFIWEWDTKILWWDHDGIGGDDAVNIARFVGISGGAAGFAASEIVVIA